MPNGKSELTCPPAPVIKPMSIGMMLAGMPVLDLSRDLDSMVEVVPAAPFTSNAVTHESAETILAMLEAERLNDLSLVTAIEKITGGELTMSKLAG